MSSDNPAPLPPTPLSWRLAIALGVVLLALPAFVAGDWIGPRGRAALGVFSFIGLVAAFSANLRAVNWRTIGMGFLIQVLLALFVLKFEVNDRKPGYEMFASAGKSVETFMEFTRAGTAVVFGDLANGPKMKEVFGKGATDKEDPSKFVPFVFGSLPTVIFVSSFFSILYYLGVLQFIVQVFARAMMFLMQTSGAETLSGTANVFMGQTEAPLIIKPYLAKMTESELLAVMVGGMATISGGMMAVYIGLGADAVAILVTSVMAAPAGLYLSKLLLPETGEPQTRGKAKIEVKSSHRNVIDAAAGGASDGLWLALNVAAMLIAFLALLAFLNHLLGMAWPQLSLEKIFGFFMYPFALLMGVEMKDVPEVSQLLGVKLAANEFVAFLNLTGPKSEIASGTRSFILTTYALTGFANFASIGIQLGGIGMMAPERRPDLARLGMRALFAGFMATLVNAAMAGVLLDP